MQCLTILMHQKLVELARKVDLYQSTSVNQIIQESNLSHSAAYRKIKQLVKEKLLIVDKIEITETGKKSMFFQDHTKIIQSKI
jgi:predicted transcriptional regulator